MEQSSRITRCSICQSTEHNKRTCPQNPIEDTFVREPEEEPEEYVTVDISPKKDRLIKDLQDKESYTLDNELFMNWLQLKKPVPLKELRYTLDQGLQKPSVILYMTLIKDIDEYY